jgi:hypothetical protein
VCNTSDVRAVFFEEEEEDEEESVSLLLASTAAVKNRVILVLRSCGCVEEVEDEDEEGDAAEYPRLHPVWQSGSAIFAAASAAYGTSASFSIVNQISIEISGRGGCAR